MILQDYYKRWMQRVVKWSPMLLLGTVSTFTWVKRWNFAIKLVGASVEFQSAKITSLRYHKLCQTCIRTFVRVTIHNHLCIRPRYFITVTVRIKVALFQKRCRESLVCHTANRIQEAVNCCTELNKSSSLLWAVFSTLKFPCQIYIRDRSRESCFRIII
jgi:hypothetical protein